MSGAFNQAWAVIGMSVAGLRTRIWSCVTTVVSIALAVMTLLAFLAMATGFSRTVAGTGADDVAIILAAGAQAEVTSAIPAESVRLLSEAPGIARDAAGRPLVSVEAFTVIDAAKTAGGSATNISLRGVSPIALEMRKDFVLMEGRMFTPGSNELIVGAGTLKQFSGFALGQERRLGQTTWRVVGVFEVGGSVFDSEVWADRSAVQSAFARSDGAQTMRVKLQSPNAIKEIEEFAAADPRLHVKIESERAYFAEQAEKLQLLVYFGWALALLLSVGALAGALNTMYAAVEARAQESATLRAIGFGRWSVFVGAMTESMVLALAGGILGAGAALVVFNGMTATTLGQGFAQVVFQLSVGKEHVQAGLLLAGALGLVGGFFPALRAATAPVLKLGVR